MHSFVPPDEFACRQSSKRNNVPCFIKFFTLETASLVHIPHERLFSRMSRVKNSAVFTHSAGQAYPGIMAALVSNFLHRLMAF